MTDPLSASEPVTGRGLPAVSIIMPVRNEERFILKALEGVVNQDYPKDRWELLVVDGMSTDGTRNVIQDFQKRDSRIRLVENPAGIVPTGFNRALALASGEIIVRLDGHCAYPSNYMSRVVTLREETGADNLGGTLEPVGSGWTQRSICAAYRSRVGVGGAALRGHSGPAVIQEVDAVHGGCWRRDRLQGIQGMDEAMVRNQDDELSFRIRKTGGRIIQATGIRVEYQVRDSFRLLFCQFAQYGYWKVRVVQKHPEQSSLRHLIPAMFVLSFLILGLLSWWQVAARWTIVGLALVYLASTAMVLTVELMRTDLLLLPGALIATAMMHLGYGCGFVLGWLRSIVGRLPSDRWFEGLTR